MLYGAMNSPLAPVLDEVRTLASLGFDYLELCLDPPMAAPDNLDPDRLKAILLEENLPALVAHLPTFVWLADIYPSIREASLNEVVKALDTCALLGIPKAVLHPGYLTGLMNAMPQAGRQVTVEVLERLLKEATARGITLCLENMFPRAGQMYRPEEFTEILNLLPGLMMTLDLAHANIKAPPNRPKALLEAGGSRIKHVHVSDNSGAEDEHLPLGAGRTALAQGLAMLKKAGYDLTITLEVFSPDRDYLRYSLEKVRRIWKEA
jgi:sugar phosphate isomerase/epimerase